MKIKGNKKKIIKAIGKSGYPTVHKSHINIKSAKRFLQSGEEVRKYQLDKLFETLKEPCNNLYGNPTQDNKKKS